jgi:hypothetical protein
MRNLTARRLLAPALAAALLSATATAAAAAPAAQALTAPIGSTLPYLEQDDVVAMPGDSARFLALQEATQMESR